MIVVGCPIILPRESESVLLGAAILGAVGARKFSSLNEAMRAMNAAGQVYIMVVFLSFLYFNAILFLYIQDEVRKELKLRKGLECSSGVKPSAWYAMPSSWHLHHVWS
jgi:hypothetical protein